MFGITSKTLSWFRVSLMYRSFSGHMSGHVPTKASSRSVCLDRPVKTPGIFLLLVFHGSDQTGKSSQGGDSPWRRILSLCSRRRNFSSAVSATWPIRWRREEGTGRSELWLSVLISFWGSGSNCNTLAGEALLTGELIKEKTSLDLKKIMQLRLSAQN